MAERAKFEKWITDLEAKRTSTPEHVFDRVHADYSLRLEGVLEKLREHTSAMREHSENLAKKLKELETAEHNLLDERAENELRAEVGELSEDDWEAFSKRAEKTLSKLQEDQELIATDLERIRDLLGSVEAKPKAASQPTPNKGVDELEFLKSVVGTGHGHPTSKPAAQEPAKAEKPPAAPVPTPAPAPPAQPAQPVARKAPTPVPPAAAVPAEPPIAKQTPTGPSLLRTTGSQDVPKTLKCAECGAMNYPSEWYCERCGAELANI